MKRKNTFFGGRGSSLLDSLCDLPRESYLILNISLPCIFVWLIVLCAAFLDAYARDPHLAVYIYRPFVEYSVSSVAFAVIAAVTLDLIDMRRGG